MNQSRPTFQLDEDAAEYIRKRSDSIVISLKLEPAIGGCACSTTRVTGSYLPIISLGAPTETNRYQVESIDGISIYFPDKVQVKADSNCIRIILKTVLFYSWLELEGAKAFALYN